ncbi:hypothetical protein J2X83_005995, partial [Brevibacillus nitrificans]|nr:hypothetical protein [Brevibacillus nitrificans]
MYQNSNHYHQWNNPMYRHWLNNNWSNYWDPYYVKWNNNWNYYGSIRLKDYGPKPFACNRQVVLNTFCSLRLNTFFSENSASVFNSVA